jgi:hypothetical protein
MRSAPPYGCFPLYNSYSDTRERYLSLLVGALRQHRHFTRSICYDPLVPEVIALAAQPDFMCLGIKISIQIPSLGEESFR